MLMLVCVLGFYLTASLILGGIMFGRRRRQQLAAQRLQKHAAPLRGFRYRVAAGPVTVTLETVTRTDVVYTARRGDRLVGYVLVRGFYPLVNVYVRGRPDQEWSFVHSDYETGCDLTEVASRYLV